MEKILNDFFSFLFPKLENQFIEIRFKKPTDTQMQQLWYQNISDLINDLRENWEDVKTNEMYFGVCPRTEKKGVKSVIKNVSTLWLDIDFKDLDPNENLQEKLSAFGLQPHLMVNSGHGLHLYWLIEEVLLTEEVHINKIEGIMKGLAKELHGDNTYDISRMLRIPETYNNKDKDKPRKVEIQKINEIPRYNITDFEKFYIETAQIDVQSIQDFQQIEIDVETLKVPQWIKVLITQGWEKDSRYKSKSELDVAVMEGLVKYKIDDDTICSIFTNPKYKISLKTLEKGKSATQYLSHTLSKAKKYHEEKQTEWAKKVDKFADFSGVEEIFNKWFYIEDQDYLKVITACIISHYFDAKPVWLLVVAPPSATKTAFLMPFCILPNTHLIGKLTAKAFFSAESLKTQYLKAKDKSHDPSLLYRFNSGILIAKDFTTILQLSADTRAEILQDLREIWDGRLSKDTGKGAMPIWEGKITFIAGCTEFYESFREIDQTMGERFLLYKNVITDKLKATTKAMQQIGKETRMVKELEETITLYFNKIEIDKDINKIEIPDHLLNQINYLSNLVVLARSSVQRDYKHSIIHAPGAEYPFRLANQLLILAKATAILNKHSEVTEDEIRIIKKIGLMTIANERYKILDHLIKMKGNSCMTREIRNDIQMDKDVFHRVMENLVEYRLVSKEERGEGLDHLWRITDLAVNLIEKAEV